jgi:hypothetical protein
MAKPRRSLLHSVIRSFVIRHSSFIRHSDFVILKQPAGYKPPTNF